MVWRGAFEVLRLYAGEWGKELRVGGGKCGYDYVHLNGFDWIKNKE